MSKNHRRALQAFAIAAIGATAAGVFGCGSRDAQRLETYPSPRYPKYLVNPSVADMMTAARTAVRQPYGRSPLGKMQSGQRVSVFVQYGQDDRVWEAIRQAWAERGVTATTLGSWDLMGITKEEYLSHLTSNLLYGSEGWQEMGVFRREYREFFPESVQRSFKDAYTSTIVRRRIGEFLDAHPEIHFFYAGQGGGGAWRSGAGAHASKFMGNWIYESPMDLLGKASEFPGDVWNMVDDKIVKPIPHVSEGTFVDPEGTRLHWTLTPEQRKIWSERTGTNNHLNVYPTGEQATWTEGVIRASANHTGFYPAMSVRLSRNGRVERVEGGGKTGELFRMLIDHPKMRTAKFPGAPEAGYWYFSQDGFATNPKFVRDLARLEQGSANIANLAERNRAGVQHFSFSYPGRSDDPRDAEYAKAHGVPLEHTAHMHVYFPTVRWRMADTGEWMTVAERGYVKAFDDAEVRALAARYGDPALIFRYEWIPTVPGVNAPGEHEKYERDPWSFIAAEWKRIQSGAYEFYVNDYTLAPSVSSRRQ